LHRSIVAPLTATLAASVAVGVGIVLARAGRERGELEQRRRERELGLRPGEPPEQALRRMALGQIDLALELLARDHGSTPSEKAVHETRKAMKRLRALLRLIEDELPADTFARENAALRGVAERLAGPRDAEVMLATLDALIERGPRKLRRRKGVRRLRHALLAQRQTAAAKLDGDAVIRASAELRELRARVERWTLPALGESDLIAGGLARLYRQGRGRGRRATRRRGKDSEAMHDWRKRVKSLRYAAEMLERHVPAEIARGSRAKQLRVLARRADQLGEVLGEDHDLAVLAELIRAAGKRKRLDRRTRKLLLELVAARQRKLRRRALREGRHLYRRPTKQFVRSLS
jgi:CHAD domain-containing protein